MIELSNNKELRDLGFKMLIPVHDEIIAECPKENSARCAELMSEMMLKAGKDLEVPLKCDVDAFYHWYGEVLDPVTLKPVGH
jgi:DNA polymerase-1